MKKFVSFLALVGLVVAFSGCVITPKEVKTSDEKEAVVEDEEVVEDEKVEEKAVEEEAVPAEEPEESEESEEVSEPAEEAEELPAEVAAVLDLPAICLDFPENVTLLNEPFKTVGEYGESAGQATLTGTVKTATADFFGNNFEYVYFMISDSSSDFYKYFKGMVDSGNTVNMAEGEVLGFTLGVLEDGKLSTSSLVPESTQEKILGTLNTGEEVSLKLAVPKYTGKGAAYNFSFACVIE